ncbi:MAG: hypothetical protein K2Q26_09640 [Bdellovibrionales bacterium]|nr:hypothetical protein [Bdellovibrionales bacterium]
MKPCSLFFALIVWSVYSLASSSKMTSIYSDDLLVTTMQNADDGKKDEVLKTVYFRKVAHPNPLCRGKNSPNGGALRTEAGRILLLDCENQYSIIECNGSEKTNCLILNKDGIPAVVINAAMSSIRRSIISMLIGDSNLIDSREWTNSKENTRALLTSHSKAFQALMSDPKAPFEPAIISVKSNASQIFQQILYYGAGVNAAEREVSTGPR